MSLPSSVQRAVCSMQGVRSTLNKRRGCVQILWQSGCCDEGTDSCFLSVKKVFWHNGISSMVSDGFIQLGNQPINQSVNSYILSLAPCLGFWG